MRVFIDSRFVLDVLGSVGISQRGESLLIVVACRTLEKRVGGARSCERGKKRVGGVRKGWEGQEESGRGKKGVGGARKGWEGQEESGRG